MQVTINGLAIHGRHHLATESSSIRLVEGLELVHTEFLHMVTQSLKSEYIHIIFTLVLYLPALVQYLQEHICQDPATITVILGRRWTMTRKR